MKIKLLVAAVALAASAQASASILQYTGSQTGAGAGLNEAFLSAWDPVTQTSYTQDLGITYGTLYSNLNNAGYSIHQAVDSTVWNQAFSGANMSDIIWNVAVSNSMKTDFSNATTTYGLLGTHVASSPSDNFVNYSALENAIQIVDEQAVAENSTDLADGQSSPTNLAYYGTVSNGGYSGLPSWSWNYSGSLQGLNTASLGTDLNFIQYHVDANGNPIMNQAAGHWSFDGKSIDYVAATPLPASVWLLASGVIGLVGVSRRKKQAA